MLQMSMSKLGLKVLFGMCALMFSASVGYPETYKCNFKNPPQRSYLPTSVILNTTSRTANIWRETYKVKKSKGLNRYSWQFTGNHAYGSYKFVFTLSLKSVSEITDADLLTQEIQGGWDNTMTKTFGSCTLIRSKAKTHFTPKVQSSLLNLEYNKLSDFDRKKIQINLASLGYYTSFIDGLFGKGTDKALNLFNNKFLDSSNLRVKQNVEKLFIAVLNFKKSSEPQETKIEKPKTEIEPKEETKPERDLEKEFELSIYGSFLHTEKIPYALFFLNEIQQYDRFEFRKALRTHDIDLIVLSSPGGSVWEGLSMAGIIYDKKLNTYIPKISGTGEGDCASACSFMFFAGNKRVVEGKLGVHQFYSEEGSKKEKVEAVQEGTQFTVSEIIGFLNEFGTPSWVFERMFQQSEMYYFKEKELVQLETEVTDELKGKYAEAQKFINDLSKALQEISN